MNNQQRDFPVTPVLVSDDLTGVTLDLRTQQRIVLRFEDPQYPGRTSTVMALIPKELNLGDLRSTSDALAVKLKGLVDQKTLRANL